MVFLTAPGRTGLREEAVVSQMGGSNVVSAGHEGGSVRQPAVRVSTLLKAFAVTMEMEVSFEHRCILCW